MAEIIGIDSLTAYNKLQTYKVLALDCRSRENWNEDHLIKSLPCPVTQEDVEEGKPILELLQEYISDYPEFAKRAKRARLETKILYGDPERTAIAANLVHQWNPKSQILLLKPEELTKLRELAPFCFSNLDLMEKKMEKAYTRKSHPNLILEEGLWLGAAVQATNRTIVKDIGVSHVLNATTGCPCQFEDDDELKIEYLRINIEDVTEANIAKQIPSAIAFIKKGLKEGSGVLVHCMCGISRSVSLTMAYLVSERGMSLKQAFDLVREKRHIACPNVGFIKQLGDFELSIRGTTTYREIYNIAWDGYDHENSKSVKDLFGDNRGCCSSCELL